MQTFTFYVVCVSHLPTWYKSALFNELYFVSDGGTVWVDAVTEGHGDAKDDVSPVVKEYGKFAYLEGMCLSTCDLW